MTRTLRFAGVGAVALIFAVPALSARKALGLPLGMQIIHLVSALAFGVATLCWLIGDIRLRSLFNPALRWPLLGAAGFTFAALLASAMSVVPGKSLRLTLTLIVGFLVYVTLVLVLRDLGAVRIIVGVAVAASLLVTIPAVIAGPLLVARLDAAVVHNRPTSSFADPNELGHYSAIILLLALGWLLAASHYLERIVATIGALAAVGALALTLSRGAWLGAILGVVALMILHPAARRLIALFLMAVAVVSGILFVVMPQGGPVGVIVERAQSISNPSGNPYDVRPTTWAEATRLFSERPVLGYGPGSFSVLSAQSGSKLQFYPRKHAHNGALTIAAEMGLAGLAGATALTLAIALTLWRASRALRQQADSLAAFGLLAGATGALVAVGGHLLVDYPLRNPTLMITVWALAGLALAAAAIAHDEGSCRSSMSSPRGSSLTAPRRGHR